MRSPYRRHSGRFTPGAIIHVLATKFSMRPRAHSQESQADNHLNDVMMRKAPPVACFFKERRDAALREHALLPPLQVHELRENATRKDGRQQKDDISEADRIKREWQSRNIEVEEAQRARMSTFRFGAPTGPLPLTPTVLYSTDSGAGRNSTIESTGVPPWNESASPDSPTLGYEEHTPSHVWPLLSPPPTVQGSASDVTDSAREEKAEVTMGSRNGNIKHRTEIPQINLDTHLINLPTTGIFDPSVNPLSPSPTPTTPMDIQVHAQLSLNSILSGPEGLGEETPILPLATSLSQHTRVSTLSSTAHTTVQFHPLFYASEQTEKGAHDLSIRPVGDSTIAIRASALELISERYTLMHRFEAG